MEWNILVDRYEGFGFSLEDIEGELSSAVGIYGVSIEVGSGGQISGSVTF